jgi:molybdopterin-guanine dinucleotide biosynthesis protein A
VVQRLQGQVDEIIISANRNAKRYARYGRAVVADANPNFDGPLSGVLSGLRACKTRWIVSVPCDAPRLPADLVARLLERAIEADAEVACARDPERLQPAFCAYRADLVDSLQDYLASGERKIDKYLSSRRWVTVEFADGERAFANLNTSEEVASFELEQAKEGRSV